MNNTQPIEKGWIEEAIRKGDCGRCHHVGNLYPDNDDPCSDCNRNPLYDDMFEGPENKVMNREILIAVTEVSEHD